jgi:outer membrane protein insertion porin family
MRGRGAVVCVLSALMLAVASGASSQSLPVVGSIEVQGNDTVAEGTILASTALRVGEPYTQLDLAQAVRNLYATGLFGQVVIDEERLGEVSLLMIRVTELPTLLEWRIQGNRKLKGKDLDEVLTLKAGQRLRPQQLYNSRRALLEAYKERGYLLADVDVREEGEGPHRTVVIKVDEGERVRIKTITFEGNTVFTDRKLKKKMSTKQKGFLRSGRFDEDKFTEDLDKVLGHYRDNGYLDARVLSQETSYSADGRWMYLQVKLEEGPQYRVGDVSVVGNSPEKFPTEQLQGLVRLKTGDVFREDDLEKSLTALYERYQEDGYIFAGIDPVRSTEQDSVELVFDIREGPRAKIEEITIEGNDKTKEKVIRRELVLFPGDMLRRSLLIRSQREIFNLGFFDDVGVDFDELGDNGAVKLIFRVKEKERGVGQFNFGASYSSSSKLTGFVMLAHPNIMGNGWEGNTRWEFGRYARNYELGFTEPWLLGTPTSLGINLFRTRRSTYYDSDIDRVDRRGGDISVGRPLPGVDFVSAQLRYTLEDVDVTYEEGVEAQDYPEGLTSSMRLRLVRDSRDNFLAPTSGSRTLLSTTLAGKMLGGDVAFHKEVLQSSWFFPFRPPVVLMLEGKLGAVTGFGDHAVVPVYERFRPGGTGYDGTVRGYEDYSLGPRDSAGLLIGGRSCLTVTAQLIFPVVDQIRLLGFFDAGDAWESFTHATPSRLKKGVGLGIRIDTGVMGVLGFDYGYGFDRPGGPGWEPHFQFGTLF